MKQCGDSRNSSLHPGMPQSCAKGETDKRCEMAERLRNEGLTFRQIGIALNVSLERARQLVLGARRLREQERKCKSIPWFSLSTRTRNRIMYELSCGAHSGRLDGFPSPQQVRELVDSGIIPRQLPNFGKHSFKEIEEWLSRHGA